MSAEATTQDAAESDSALLGRYIDSGDMDAFAALVKRYTQTVYGVCVRQMWRNRDLAQDATQLVFVLLAKQAGSLRGRSEVGSWLHRAAVFTAMRVYAKESRREAVMNRYADDTNDGGKEASGLLNRAGVLLDVAVSKLSEKYRQVLVMHYFQGLTYDQIAAGTGSPPGTVRTHLDRARGKLRAELARLNLALAPPLVLQLLQGGGTLQLPSGLVESCVNAVMPGGAGGDTAELDAILKDMHSAESWKPVAKVALGACAAAILAVAAFAAAHREPGQSIPAPAAALPAAVQRAENDILFRDDFRNGFADWEVMEQTPGKEQLAAGEPERKLVQTCRKDGNDVLLISAPRKPAAAGNGIKALGVRLKLRLPPSGYIAEWDERRDDVGADVSTILVGANNYVLRSEVTNFTVPATQWLHKKLVCTPAESKDGLPRWRLDAYLNNTLLSSYDLSFDSSIFQINAHNGRVMLDNVVVRRLPGRE